MADLQSANLSMRKPPDPISPLDSRATVSGSPLEFWISVLVGAAGPLGSTRPQGGTVRTMDAFPGTASVGGEGDSRAESYF